MGEVDYLALGNGDEPYVIKVREWMQSRQFPFELHRLPTLVINTY